MNSILNIKTNTKLNFNETLDFIVNAFNQNFKIIDTQYIPNDSFDFSVENDKIAFDITNLTFKGEINDKKYNLTKNEFPEFYLLLDVNKAQFELTPDIKVIRKDGNKVGIEVSLPESFFNSEKFNEKAFEIAEYNFNNHISMEYEAKHDAKRDDNLLGR